jgi:hypothetical protein
VSIAVVARNLNSPRKIFIAPSGAIYVAEAGAGGRDKCLGSGQSMDCVGLTGSITRVSGSTQQRVVVGLPSIAKLNDQRAEGPADVAVVHGRYYVLLQDGVINRKGRNLMGPDGKVAGDLIATPPGYAAPKVVADFARFEAENNPDKGLGPGAGYGSPPIDSDPYAFTPYRGGFAVADAAGNDLLWAAPNGKISVLAVFPPQHIVLTTRERTRFGLPPSLKSILAQSVPTSVAVGPDGALYVGELTGLPFRSGTARIWRVTSSGRKSVFARGFTTVSDIAFDNGDLLVLELSVKSIATPGSPGALIRVSPNGARAVVASKGLVAPTGLAVARGSIYISNYGIHPAAGPGPHGELIRLSGQAGK